MTDDHHEVPFVVSGPGLGVEAPRQRRYSFELQCARQEAHEWEQLNRLLHAWYELGFYGAFGEHFTR